jgi:hypothetical protein
MSKKIIDYSSDSIFKASKRVAKTALKNIQPPPMPITEMPTVTNTLMQQPINGMVKMTSAISDVKASPSSMVTTTKEYTDLLKYFSLLNHHLDELNSELQARNEHEWQYPKITMKNKINHNEEFNKKFNKTEKRDYLIELKPEIENKLLNEVAKVSRNSLGHDRNYLHLKEFVDKIVPKYLMTDAEKQTLIDAAITRHHHGAGLRGGMRPNNAPVNQLHWILFKPKTNIMQDQMN